MINRILAWSFAGICFLMSAVLSPVHAGERPPISRLEVCNALSEGIEVATEYSYRDAAGKLQFPQQGWLPIDAHACKAMTFDPPVDGKDGDVYFSVHSSKTNRWLHSNADLLQICGKFPDSFRNAEMNVKCGPGERTLVYNLPNASQFSFRSNGLGRVTFHESEFSGRQKIGVIVVNNSDAMIRRMQIVAGKYVLKVPPMEPGAIRYFTYAHPLTSHCGGKIIVDLANGKHYEQPEDICEGPFIGVEDSLALGWPWPFLAISIPTTPTPIDTPAPAATPDVGDAMADAMSAPNTVLEFLVSDCEYNSFKKCASHIESNVSVEQRAFCDIRDTELRSQNVAWWLEEHELDREASGRLLRDTPLIDGIHLAMKALAPGC